MFYHSYTIIVLGIMVQPTSRSCSLKRNTIQRR